MHSGTTLCLRFLLGYYLSKKQTVLLCEDNEGYLLFDETGVHFQDLEMRVPENTVALVDSNETLTMPTFSMRSDAMVVFQAVSPLVKHHEEWMKQRKGMKGYYIVSPWTKNEMMEASYIDSCFSTVL